MIDNNDSRYAFQWLKDGYKEIALENLEASWSVGEKVQKVEEEEWLDGYDLDMGIDYLIDLVEDGWWWIN